tara:strand:+ start:138 stop:1967 length:1830 start_codon:yes stop_codon:yes gene_type:complete
MRPLILLPLILTLSTPAKAAWWDFSPDCSKKEYSTKELTRRSKPGVVMISTNKATGSGFVVRHLKNQTLILTNSHVLQGANQITVEWPDGNQDQAEVALDGGGQTTLTDLALLKIDGKEGSALTLKEEQATVGGDVIAIGAPRGLGFTLTKGVISSLRDNGKIVQTDTAINPGSSGGPLINSSGCVVGVNTLGMVDDVGLNFAISSQTAQRFIDKYIDPNKDRKTKNNNTKDIKDKNSSNKGNIGISFNTVNEDYPEIVFVLKGSGAEKAGVRVNDLILSVDGQSAKGVGSEITKLLQGDEGSKVNLKLKRNERELKLKVIRKNHFGIQINPDDYGNMAEAYIYRAVEKATSKDYQGAIKDYNEALKLNLKDERKLLVFALRGRAKSESEDFQGGLEDYNQSLNFNQQDKHKAFLYLSKAWVKNNLKDYKGAIADSRKALKLDPKDEHEGGIYQQLGFAKMNLKDFKGAIADYKKSLDFDPEDDFKVIIYGNLSFISMNLQDHEGSKKYLNQAFSLDSVNNEQISLLYANRCLSNINLNLYQEAIEDCTKAIDLNPKDSNSYNNRGVAFSNIFSHKEACFDYKKANALGNSLSRDFLKSRKGAWCRNMQ